MSRTPREGTRRAGALALLPLLLLLCSAQDCVPRPIVARIATRVEAGGTIEREVRLSGTPVDASETLDATWWRERAEIDLNGREHWARVEEGPGWIVASGRFADPASVPAPIGHLLPGRAVADRDLLTLERRDLLLATHLVYREEYGDPFDETARDGALDDAILQAKGLIAAALRRHFGAGADLSAVQLFIERDLRALAAEARRRGDIDLPEEAFAAVGLPPPRDDVPTGADGKPLAEPEEWWFFEQLAQRLVTRGTPADAEDVRRAFEEFAIGEEGTDERLTEQLGVYFWGVYGEPVPSASVRFEWRLGMPGRLLRTNGVPEEGGAAWSFPDDRLTAEDRLMTAESVVLRRESLRLLGARATFDAVETERLVELLAEANGDSRGRSFLQRAVDAGSLDALRDAPPGEPDFPIPLFRELADLLDPAVAGPRGP